MAIPPVLQKLDTELSINNVNGEIVALNYDVERGLHVIYEVNPSKKCEITFQAPIIGFRMLDEGDLLEFWVIESYNGAGMYEVISGGWYDLEKTRSGFLTAISESAFKEYLITSSNACLSILTLPDNKPEIILKLL